MEVRKSHQIKDRFVDSRDKCQASYLSHQFLVVVETHAGYGYSHWHPSTLKSLYDDTKGAFFQSVFSNPPLVAQSSAFHMLENKYIGFSFGKKLLPLSVFLNTLIGTLSTKNLPRPSIPND